MVTKDVTMTWNGDLWVAQFERSRYADCNKNRLSKRLYDAGATAVYEELVLPARKTVWERLADMFLKLLKRK